MTTQTKQQAIYCDCCGTEVMAKRSEDRIVIQDRRHGRRHVAVIPLDKTQFNLQTNPKLNKDG